MDYCGEKAQFIRPSVIRLTRGQVFTIEGKQFFAMGGAFFYNVDNSFWSYHGNAKIIDNHYLMYDDIVPLPAVEERFGSKKERFATPAAYKKGINESGRKYAAFQKRN